VQLVDIDLSKVEAQTYEEDKLVLLDVFFDIYNDAYETLTISKVDYELFADNMSLGKGVLSYEDIPFNGRPGVFPVSNLTVTSPFRIETPESSNGQISSRILENPQIIEQIKWKVKGLATMESLDGSFYTKQFSSG
jgi:hypothetical protein